MLPVQTKAHRYTCLLHSNPPAVGIIRLEVRLLRFLAFSQRVVSSRWHCHLCHHSETSPCQRGSIWPLMHTHNLSPCSPIRGYHSISAVLARDVGSEIRAHSKPLMHWLGSMAFATLNNSSSCGASLLAEDRHPALPQRGYSTAPHVYSIMYCREALLLLCTSVLLLPCWSLPNLLEEQLHTTCYYDYNHRRCDVSPEALLRLTPASSQVERCVIAGSLARDVVRMQSCSSSTTGAVRPGTFSTLLQQTQVYMFISA
jgi:hypothetical protein